MADGAMSTTNTEDSMRWGDPHRGVTLDQLQVWRDAETQNVIFQVPAGREQVVMSPEQWDRAVEFLNAACTCSNPPDMSDALCPIHDHPDA